jgi:hypothetical protein
VAYFNVFWYIFCLTHLHLKNNFTIYPAWLKLHLLTLAIICYSLYYEKQYSTFHSNVPLRSIIEKCNRLNCKKHV